MQVTRKGTIYDVPGTQPKVGDQAKEFQLKSLEDKDYRLADFLGKPTILSIVPDIDTRVCALQTKRFNEEASKIAEVNFVTISNNTKEEQANWCGKEGIDMLMLHDPENTFGETYQIMIPELGHFARAIFVLDENGVIRYEEIVPEISHEPDYQAALSAARSIAV
ncbi:thiol peroxidase [Enterococcus sp.]|jgi:thiol peroxidase|uniref:thiol peroxidase n=1 Tax=Enterococcus sp. TaxID=35783 RepID=UPI0025C4F219|nr:thiol peroxidase [Enterococcus sp.]